MSHKTVFPDMLVGFAEAIAEGINDWEATHRVQAPPSETSDELNDSVEDISRIVDACRDVRRKVEQEIESLKKRLLRGVDAISFVAKNQPLLVRLDKMIVGNSATLAAADRLQQASGQSNELYRVFEELNESLIVYRDILKNGVSAMQSPRGPIDWDRVKAAQESLLKGETKVFAQASGKLGK